MAVPLHIDRCVQESDRNNTTVSSFVSDYRTTEQRWAAIRSRDRAANTAFNYGVVTTRIFCRPTCLARVARKANVVFFDDVDMARAQGYRACKRCKPEEKIWHREGISRHIVAQSQTLIDQAVLAQRPWTVEQISGQLGVTAAHLHRLFKKHCHMTPKEFGSRSTHHDHPLPQLNSVFDSSNDSWPGFSTNQDRVWDDISQVDEGIPWSEWLVLETFGLD